MALTMARHGLLTTAQEHARKGVVIDGRMTNLIIIQGSLQHGRLDAPPSCQLTHSVLGTFCLVSLPVCSYLVLCGL